MSDDPILKYFDPADWWSLVEERSRGGNVGKYPRHDADGNPITKNPWIKRRADAAAKITPEEKRERTRKLKSESARKRREAERREMMRLASRLHRAKKHVAAQKWEPYPARILKTMTPCEWHTGRALAEALGVSHSPAAATGPALRLVDLGLAERMLVRNTHMHHLAQRQHPEVWAYRLTERGAEAREALLRGGRWISRGRVETGV